MNKKPIYYDTETTGIRIGKDRIIELAAYDPISDRTFVELIHPGMSIPSEATAIHKISDEMVKESRTFDLVAAAFQEFCGKEALLIAHNNDAFDKLFLQSEFERCNLPFPPWQFLDTLKWARRYRPDLPRHSLQYLREVYGIAANQAHRALDDVKVLHALFSQMIDDLSWETIMALLSRPTTLTRMPFGKHQGKALADVPKNYVKWLQESGALDKPENQELREMFEALGSSSSA